MLPDEDHMTVEQLTEHLMSRADKRHDGRITKDEFIEAALESKTIQHMIKGELKVNSFTSVITSSIKTLGLLLYKH